MEVGSLLLPCLRGSDSRYFCSPVSVSPLSCHGSADAGITGSSHCIRPLNLFVCLLVGRSSGCVSQRSGFLLVRLEVSTLEMLPCGSGMDLPGTSHLAHHSSPLHSFIHSFGQLARLPEALLGDDGTKVNLCRALSLSHGTA